MHDTDKTDITASLATTNLVTKPCTIERACRFKLRFPENFQHTRGNAPGNITANHNRSRVKPKIVKRNSITCCTFCHGSHSGQQLHLNHTVHENKMYEAC